MQILEIAPENMHPRVLLARLYDTIAMKHTVKKRISDTYEISFYLEGDGDVTVGDTVYPIKPSAIRIVPPGTPLTSIPHYRCITVFFDFGSANTVVRNSVLEGIPHWIATEGEMQGEFEALLQAYQSTSPTAPVAQNGILLSVLAKLYDRAHSDRRYSDAVRKSIHYMQSHFSENVTLEVLGELTGYSNLHLLRLFRQDLGQTPHDFLTAIRMEQAKKLLSETDMGLEEIAQFCGFRSVSHFKSLFKQLTHYTPGSYRKNTRQL